MKLSEVLELVPGLVRVKVSIYLYGFRFSAHACCDLFKGSRFVDMRVTQMFVNDGRLEIELASETEEMGI